MSHSKTFSVEECQRFATAIRIFSADGVQSAKSGHPGMPMGMADIAAVLWLNHLSHHPENSRWLNRDRFILSNGHGSMLHYALLHLTGYPLTKQDLKDFRQLGSKTPGHPEVDITPGVETTTGPLGQGLANAVGMAIAEQSMAATFNKPDYKIFDHFTYVFLGDGCLMEGISHEVASLAGTLKLNKLIAIYDDNGISIDGDIKGWFTDDTPARFRSYDWHVIEDVDGHDYAAIEDAITLAKKSDKPTLICCKTQIGYGSPNLAGSEKSHGAPLGEKELGLLREVLNWSHEPFEWTTDAYHLYDAREAGELRHALWQTNFDAWSKSYPKLAEELERRFEHKAPEGWSESYEAFIKQCQAEKKTMATRKASQCCLEAISPMWPELLGGSADLTGSNLTLTSDMDVLTSEQPNGRYINYGVREFGMSAIMNGVALYGGFVPYAGTFLTFLDYARNAVRMAALMERRVIFVYTHDSIGLGEDGPTHQPVEHLAMLRLTPNLDLWRPADITETAVAWQAALMNLDKPTALALSRQGVPGLERNEKQVKDIAKGGYILADGDGDLDVILIATGTEVSLALEARLLLMANKISVRVVSMPCVEQFLRCSSDYQQEVLPSSVRQRIAIEAASSDYWYRLVGLDGAVMGVDDFGISAPGPDVYRAKGLTVGHIVERAQQLINDSTKVSNQ